MTKIEQLFQTRNRRQSMILRPISSHRIQQQISDVYLKHLKIIPVHRYNKLNLRTGPISGQILCSARKAAGLTQSELAARINSTKSYISKLEKGHINPSAGLFFSIINVLGMRVEIVKPI